MRVGYFSCEFSRLLPTSQATGSGTSCRLEYRTWLKSFNKLSTFMYLAEWMDSHVGVRELHSSPAVAKDKLFCCIFLFGNLMGMEQTWPCFINWSKHLGLLGTHSKNTRGRGGRSLEGTGTEKGLYCRLTAGRGSKRLSEIEHIILWGSIATVPHAQIKEGANKLVPLCLDSYHSQPRRTEVRGLGKLHFYSTLQNRSLKGLIELLTWQFSWAQWASHSAEWMGNKMEPHPLAFCRKIKRESSYPSPSKWIRVSLQRGRTKPMVQVLLQDKKQPISHSLLF